MVEYVRSFTVDTPDSEGRYLIGSDEIVDVQYYDSTSESWRRDYSTLNNPFTNPDFTATTVTGTGPNGATGPGWYETGTDTAAAQTQRFFKIGKIPFDYTDELIATYGSVVVGSSTTTINGDRDRVSGDFFIDAATFTAPPKNLFPTNYTEVGWSREEPWATSSGIPGTGHGHIAYQFSPNQEVVGFYIDSYDGDDTTDAQATAAVIRTYEIQVALTGTGLGDVGYTTIASGTVPYGWTHPLWIEVPPTEAKFIRIKFKNNGSTVRSGLVKFFAYSQEVIDRGMALIVTRVGDLDSLASAGKTFELNQVVDFTGIDNVYFDVIDYTEEATNQFEIFIDSFKDVDFLTPNLLSSSDVYTMSRGVSSNVVGVGSNTVFKISKLMTNNESNSSALLVLGNISVAPGWFLEAASEKRGSIAKFPDRVFIVSDFAGLSIIDADNLTLWMRFDLGYKKMLQLRPRKIAAKNGKIYLATSRGLYILDFPGNRCTLINERGVLHRYGIDYRNENSFDFEEWTENLPPSRILLGYMRHETPTIPELSIYDIACGIDDTFGDFVVLGTSKGLLVYNDSITSSADFFTSANTAPVSKVAIVNDSIWYLQGEDDAQTLNYISSVNNADSDGFSPDSSYYKPLYYTDDLSAISEEFWEVLNQDPAMEMVSGPSLLTISGSHSRGGTTGLIYKQRLANRSFTAKVKVKILDFPADARGAVRFGICNDYKYAGVLSLDSDFGENTRSGFFISAYNTDPYGWPFFNSAPLTGARYDDNIGWFFVGQDDGGDSVTKVRKVGTPTDDGLKVRSYSTRAEAGGSDNLHILTRMSSVQPVLARDFTARAQIQLPNGFPVPNSTSTSRNATAWFGTSTNAAMVPGAEGTGNSVDSSMMIAGNTTFSGVLVYTTGKFSSTGNPTSVSLTQPKITIGSTEGTGHTTSPYREWRIDYNHGNNVSTYYLDGELVGSLTSTAANSPNRFGLTFGVGQHLDTTAGGQRVMYAKDLSIEYPLLISGSRYKYGLEVSNDYGDIAPVFTHYTTYSGLSSASDSVPASGTLSALAGLSNGNLTTGVVSLSTDISAGIGFPQARTVESLFIYDSSTSTSGWDDTTSKRVDVWHSSDNVSWTFYKEYNLNYQERLSGLTKLRFSPAIFAKFIKVRGISSAYAVPGGGPWAISEMRGMTVSGTSFYPTDNSSSADFHEWRLDYNANTGELRGYLDGSLISKGSYTGGVPENARVVLAHDLSVVSSGTDSNFAGEFKDFEITFSGTGALSPGDITALTINHNLVSGTSNYTVISASTENVSIADFSSVLPDQIRTFSHSVDIFGDAEKVGTVVADSNAHRSEGLVFVGTDNYKPSYYRVEDKRPIWFENWGNEGLAPGDEALQFGNFYTFIFHPAKEKIFIINDRNAAYFTVVDLENRVWSQVSRESYKDVIGVSSTGDFQTGTAKAVYSPFDGRIWMFSAPNRFCGIDIDTGNTVEGVYDTSDFENISGLEGDSDAARWFIAYALHKHRIVYGYNYIGVYDLATSTALPHPRRPSASPNRWNRQGVILPWGIIISGPDSNDGITSAVYCDYDRHIYFIATSDADVLGTNLFYRYNLDKDSLEFISSGTEDRLWPTSDESLYSGIPFNLSTHKGANLVYDSRRKRIYLITERGVRALLFYYDVVGSEWVEVGEEPPYTSLRRWPSASPEHTNYFATDTNFATYNPSSGSIYMATGRGDVGGSYIYEYFPEEVVGAFDFDYQPARDGLPTLSGLARQFTTFGGIVQNNYRSSGDFNKDFIFTSAQTGTPRFSYNFGPDYITISGNGNIVGTTETFELYISSEEVDATRSFDISAKIAFPQFTRNILYTPGVTKPAHSFFRMGVSDGFNRPWVSPTHGQEDPNLYQVVDLRVGVSGTISNSVTQFPFKAHIAYTDGFNTNGDTIATDPKLAYDSYLVGGVDLGSAFSDFRDFRLSYDYETDHVEGFLDGTSIGATTLRRKFNDNVRFHLGFSSRSSSGNTQSWAAQLKDLSITTKAWDRVDHGRLITSVSGSVGTYVHERWDSTLVSGISWAYYMDGFLPTNVGYSGYDYVASLGGIGDGHKLCELAAIYGPGLSKMVGIVGDLDQRHERSTYLAITSHLWDDLDFSNYKITRDSLTGLINVYINGASTPSMTVAYDDLPSYNYQHVYYGKVNYGNFERIYETTTRAGTWTTSPNYTGSSDPGLGRLAFNSDARFATITQGNAATATFMLDQDLGVVDLYTFYHASGFDSAKDVPYTIVCSGVQNLPGSVGEDTNIFSIEDATDEFGNFDAGKITIRVDQRRVLGGNAVNTDKNFCQGSGWIYLGRYDRPARVIITADAHPANSSTQSFVCADAIGVDIGRYGRSTFDLSVKQVRYTVGLPDLSPAPYEEAGLTVIDLSTNQTIDSYGEKTGPALLDSNISSGTRVE